MDGALIVASMGASAILLFTVPHGEFSQPWPVFGGQVVSAIVGVACSRYMPDKMLAAALCVGFACYFMYLLRCVHPPGGATALTAVMAGPDVQALGFGFVLTPVLLNVLVLLAVAVAFNAPFPARRYPAAWAKKSSRSST